MRNAPGFKWSVGFALLLVVVGLVLAVAEYRRETSEQAADQAVKMDALGRSVLSDIEKRMQAYQYGLRGARGAVITAGLEGLTRQKFRSYMQSRDLEKEFPGALGTGFIRRVNQRDINDFVQKARADGFPSFKVHRLENHDGDSLVIQYAEPEKPNFKAIGLDIASERNRANAAMGAIESGQATLTNPITLVQAEGKPRRGFLLLLPVYRPGAPIGTTAERVKAAWGLVYMPIVIDDVLSGPEFNSGQFLLTIADRSGDSGGPDALGTFYSSINEEKLSVPRLSRTYPLNIYGQQWEVSVVATQSFAKGMHERSPWTMAAEIAIGSLLLGLLANFALLSLQRRRLVAYEHSNLTAVVESSSDAIVSLDLKGNVKSWNSAAQAILGYTPQEAIGQPVTKLIIPGPLIEAELAYFAEIAAGKEVRQNITTRVRKDGSTVQVALKMSPVKDDSGRVIGISKNLRDVTEELLLQQRHQLAVQSTGIGIWTWDLKTNKSQWDTNMFRLYGYSAPVEDASDMYEIWKARVHPDDLDRAEASLSESLAHNAPYDASFRIVLNSGEVRWIQAKGAMVRNAMDEQVYMHGINIDVTELMTSRANLDDAQLRLASGELRDRALDVLAVGIVRWVRRDNEDDNVLQYANPAWLAIVGLDRSAIGTRLKPVDLIHPDDRAAYLEVTGDSHKTERQITFTLRYLRPDGSFCWGRVNATGFKVGDITYRTACVEDVTEIKNAELRIARINAELEIKRQEAEQAAVAKGNFLANMSHEIRTPMSAVMGTAYLLEKSHLAPDAAKLVRQLQYAGRVLQRILDDILDFSKLESDAMSIESTEFDLRDVLNNVQAIMESVNRGKDIEMAIAPPPFGLNRLIGDPTRLDQVVMNLVVNAAKFTETGHVYLRVNCLQRDPDKVRLRFEVEDTGIGMTPEQVDRLFVPFSQADVSTTRKFGGTGLGLVICNKLLNLMGSTLQVRSEEGKGSTFFFDISLPCVQGHAQHQTDLQGLKVVIADDSEISRESLRDTAKSLGWEPVTVVDNGADAVKAVVVNSNIPPDRQVIILDWKMPGMDGLEAARAIHERKDDHHGPIIIVATAFSRDELSGNPDIRYSDAVLNKPVTASMLFDAVSSAFSMRKGSSGVGVAVAGGRALAGIRLLLVDDSDVNLEVARNIFSGEGAEIVVKSNGKDAYEWLAQHPHDVDLVLMDIQMPVLDGYGAMALIRGNPALVHIPVVALTAGVLASSRNAVYASGMVGHIAKPMNVPVAIRTILQVLSFSGQSSVVPDTAVPPVADGAGREYPGLKIDVALEVWRDEARFRDYLARFTETLVDTRVAELDTAALKAFAHKLCGTASNLGLVDVSRTAGELEMALLEKRDADGAKQQLTQAIEVALSSIRHYLGPARAVAPMHSRVVNTTEIVRLLDQAVLAADSLSPDAIEPTLLELQALLPHVHLASLRHAQDAVSRFEFMEAKRVLQKIGAQFIKNSGEFNAG